MTSTIAGLAVLGTRETAVRVPVREAKIAIQAVTGLPAVRAVTKLRLGPGRTCEPVARVLDRALARASTAGLAAVDLVVLGGRADAGQDVVRVRRKAHGTADWISSPTSDVYLELGPAGLVGTGAVDEVAAEQPATAPVAEPRPAGMRPPATVSAIRELLYEVIDPDLGVNVVDLGFVRDIMIDDDGNAVVTMTLTSAACPLTAIMTDQIGQILRDDAPVPGIRVEWSWLPAWRPADISEDGRDQLRAIGFTGF
ncbi:MAG TPA: iron-sulfur cluster assembly protein [Pseudonocardiaceae bacterium]